MDVAGFDWDDGNRAHCRKHGVTIAEIEELFGRMMLVAPDPKHSTHEARFMAIGTTTQGRNIFVAFTFRNRGGDTLIRPISARPMHEKERRAYEKAAEKTSSPDK